MKSPIPALRSEPVNTGSNWFFNNKLNNKIKTPVEIKCRRSLFNRNCFYKQD